VRTSNEDARAFIRQSVLDTWNHPFPAYTPRTSQAAQQRKIRRDRQAVVPAADDPLTSTSTPLAASFNADAAANDNVAAPRRFVNHFVMNLPATAIEFLDAFRGLYIPLRKLDGASEAIDALGEDQYPMVHCYCFTREIDGAEKDILEVRSVLVFAPFYRH
jgi:tRNA (guanine37-N1)-methyltransferase